MVWNPFKQKKNIFKERGNLIIKLNLEGFDKKNIKVDVRTNRIYVSGERKDKEKIKKKGLFKQKIEYSSYSDSFTLPEKVIPKKAKWTYKNNILRINIPIAKS